MPVRPRGGAATALPLAAALLLALVAPAHASGVSEAAYTLRNVHTGTCLHHAVGTSQVSLEECGPVAGQRWELRAEGTATNVAAYDPDEAFRGCVTVGDFWNARFGPCRTSEAAWAFGAAPGSHARIRSESGLNGNDLYLTEAQSGHVAARPGGDGASADWIMTQVP
ncbi:hypothetical protein ACIBCA_16810 [Kitasatospora sp. NPDC051170]|uniref:hypothetical protein n=1 Tax=Kitasatospora sp. NPDC051170 TaxID=3364056 RepID=UPI003798BB00